VCGERVCGETEGALGESVCGESEGALGEKVCGEGEGALGESVRKESEGALGESVCGQSVCREREREQRETVIPVGSVREHSHRLRVHDLTEQGRAVRDHLCSGRSVLGYMEKLPWCKAGVLKSSR